ncbi:MAG: phosphoenolpyruvate--protein phosphotransferase [Verrucomicrobia bacterium]|jgi:phosphotransferase system enzyme I (PtsI)|nr:phosphoenolpyruvate--protein phosphotransferase [Verrucomicrobiota bacterium]MBT6805436.1 phosphoenolpyruvate--protein phosphotransferase [Verrucomicrobiota bacterium]MBT7537132.1 phosphoenolpyruvate--protein phosphotransferase [Verrucomicrobiota bacterium]
MSEKGEITFRGVAASGGICRGRVFVLGTRHLHVPHRVITEGEITEELKRLEQSIVTTRKQLTKLHQSLREQVDSQDADIFEAHLLVLEDQALIDETTKLVECDLCNVEYAYQKVANKYAKALESMEDDYLRERAVDLRDVSNRLLSHLLGHAEEDYLYNSMREPCIVVGHDLTPSTTVMLDRKMVLGFATDVGSKTSHTAILARALKIPAVVGLHNISSKIESGQGILLDGHNGKVIQNPSDQTLFEYGHIIRKNEDQDVRLAKVRELAAVTLDGHEVTLAANLDQASEATDVTKYGAEGVGLFRSEYLFLNRSTWPDEDLQTDVYAQVAEALSPDPIIIRTLDLGADKLSTLTRTNAEEPNPALGWRAIRYCLDHREIFKTQLKSILRAGSKRNIKIMFPMITTLSELDQALELLEESKQSLRQEGKPFDAGMKVGVMIETPGAVMIADTLASKVNFFSIGTNDLIQYSLAVDRTNDKIAHLYNPTHPGIIRSIRQVIVAAHKAGIHVGICGEMAGEPDFVPLLLGLGVDELSASAPLIPQVKYLIRRLKIEESRALAEQALTMQYSHEILEASRALMQRVAPEIVN